MCKAEKLGRGPLIGLVLFCRFCRAGAALFLLAGVVAAPKASSYGTGT